MQLTTDQILALAPDASSQTAGRKLAIEANWTGLGHGEGALWGLCKGSGARPYQTQVDLSEPAFKCSCPSRKFPCKHGLGLLLLQCKEPALFPQADYPEWVASWLEARNARQQNKAARAANAASPTPVNEEDRAKRQAERAHKVSGGIEELVLWMQDLTRDGLAQSRQRPYSYWDQMAARLVDAQAPGLARMVQELGSVASGPNWADNLLYRLGRLQLLLDGYKNLESLPEPIRQDIRTAIGFPTREEEVLAGEAVADTWWVLGRTREVEANLQVGRTWLWGQHSRRWALLLEFAGGGAQVKLSLPPGSAYQGALSYYPGNLPLRAALHTPWQLQTPLPVWNQALGEGLTFQGARQSRAAALARHPWLSLWPVGLKNCTFVVRQNDWWVRDEAGETVPLLFTAPLHTLLAVSGGQPVELFGSFDGRTLTAWGAMAGTLYVSLCGPEL